MAHGFEHPLHLVLAALVDRELDPRRAEPPHAGRRAAPVLQLDPLRQPPQRLRGRAAVDVRDVDLVHLVARMGEPVCERPVVRQQERPGRVGVEPAHGDGTGPALDQVDDGAPVVWVAGRGDDAGRLVQEDVRELLRPHALSVHLDDVALPDDGVQLAGRAVHPHAPRLDQLVRAAPRGDSRASEIRIEPHAVIIGGCRTTSP